MKTKPWKLIWSDEFDGPVGSAPDATHWGYDLGATGWGNDELQRYTDDPRNASIVHDPEAHGGKSLAIVGIKDANGDITSARIHTREKLHWTYGRFELRVRLPGGMGIWPACWLLGLGGDWPYCGEIDIVEWIGRLPSTIHGSAHGPGYCGDDASTARVTLPDGKTFTGGYYIFAIELLPGSISWYLDGHLYHSVTPKDLNVGQDWVFDDHSFYLILNLAVGGRWPGYPNETTQFPQSFHIDYVRVYDR